MLTLINYAKEGRPVVAYNISRAFLYCDMDDFVTQVVDDISVDMLLRSNPEYTKYICIAKSKKTLICLQWTKSLYSTLSTICVFQENHLGTLSGMVELNHYHDCVMSKDMNDHQMYHRMAC